MEGSSSRVWARLQSSKSGVLHPPSAVPGQKRKQPGRIQPGFAGSRPVKQEARKARGSRLLGRDVARRSTGEPTLEGRRRQQRAGHLARMEEAKDWLFLGDGRAGGGRRCELDRKEEREVGGEQ